MSIRRRVALVASLASVLLACGPRPQGPTTPPVVIPEAARRLPVLRHVPAGATYVIAVARLGDGVRLLDDLLGLAATATGFPVRHAAREVLRSALGVDLLDPTELAGTGLAVDGSAAIFSTGIFPTVALPVADRERVNAFLERATRSTTIMVSEKRGLHPTVWRGDPDTTVSYVLHGETLLVHVAHPGIERSPLDWIDGVLDAGAGVAAEADLAWALERAGSRDDAVGLVRGGALAEALAGLDALAGPPDPRCEALAGPPWLGRVALHAALPQRGLEAGAFVELQPVAAAALGAHLAPPPDGRFLRVRADAAAHVSVALDLDWLSDVSRRQGVAGCGLVRDVLHELEPWRLGDPFSALYGEPIFTSYHLAVLGAEVVPGSDASRPSLALGLAAWLGRAPGDSLERLLGIFAPGLLTSRTRIGGKAVTRLDLGFLGVAHPADLDIGTAVLRVAMGPGAMERLLVGDEPPAAPGREILSLALEPERLRDARPPLLWLAGRLELPSSDAEAFVRAVRAFRRAHVSLTAEDGGIRVAGGYELR